MELKTFDELVKAVAKTIKSQYTLDNTYAGEVAMLQGIRLYHSSLKETKYKYEAIILVGDGTETIINSNHLQGIFRLVKVIFDGTK